MDNQTIEMLLRKAPQPRVPADLLSKLRAAIPDPERQSSPYRENLSRSRFRLWFPRFAWALTIGTAVAGIVYEASRIEQLEAANAQLQSQTAQIPALRTENQEVRRMLLAARDIEKAQQDAAEAERLRAEIAALRQQMQELERLKTENPQLASQLAELQILTQTAPDFLGEEQKKAERIACVNNLKNIGLAMRIYAVDNNDVYPTSIAQMTNELSTPKLLICPSDRQHAKLRDSLTWANFSPDMCSYQLILSGEKDGLVPNRVIAKCPIHFNYGVADGSVQQVSPEKAAQLEKVVNGRLELVWPNN